MRFHHDNYKRHFHPWWHDNAYGNFTWVWICGHTKRMQFVTGVTAPIYRYHPAIIAQAFASLDMLYPGRIGLGLGSGEAMNESPLGFDWPRARARLTGQESIQIIKQLWNQRNNLTKDFEFQWGIFSYAKCQTIHSPQSIYRYTWPPLDNRQQKL